MPKSPDELLAKEQQSMGPCTLLQAVSFQHRGTEATVIFYETESETEAGTLVTRRVAIDSDESASSQIVDTIWER